MCSWNYEMIFCLKFYLFFLLSYFYYSKRISFLIMLRLFLISFPISAKSFPFMISYLSVYFKILREYEVNKVFCIESPLNTQGMILLILHYSINVIASLRFYSLNPINPIKVSLVSIFLANENKLVS
jgi:hypothetical protein